jgi:hypothetical protein
MSPILPGIVASGISGHLFTPEGSAYEIAKYTVPSGGIAEVTFAVPSDYRHIELVGAARCAASSDRNLRMYINGDTANSNYRQHWLYGNGSGAASESNQIAPQIGYLPMSSDTAGIFGVTTSTILDYNSTTKVKVVKSIAGWDGNGSTSGLVTISSAGYYANTAPVTSLTIKMSNGSSLAEHSNFTLIGYK